ncbi:MAG: SRPBCC family protein [Dehalococcoidia bacterium]
MWQGTERIKIDASPEDVWAIVTDVARHQELAGSGEIRAIRVDGPIAEGTTWEADESIKMVGSFIARSECVVFDPPLEFSWKSYPPPLKKGNPDSVPNVTWWFRLTPHDGGTQLEHSFRVIEPKSGGMMIKTFYLVTRRASTIRKGMLRTLDNMKAAAERQEAAEPFAVAGP